MNKILLLLISLLFFNIAMAQEQAIKVTNVNTNKEKIIKENRRVKIKTSDGQKVKGRFKIENDNTIVIKNKRISLADVQELKRNPLLISILTSGFFIYVGIVTTGIAVWVGVVNNSSAFLLFIPAVGMIYAGIKPPSISKNHKVSKGWKFEVIQVYD